MPRMVYTHNNNKNYSKTTTQPMSVLNQGQMNDLTIDRDISSPKLAP